MRNVIIAVLVLLLGPVQGLAKTVTLQSDLLRLQVDDRSGRWTLLDRRSAVSWPSDGTASAGTAAPLEGDFSGSDSSRPGRVTLMKDSVPAVVFELVAGGEALEISYKDRSGWTIRTLEDALAATDVENAAMVVPCREGLLIPADSGKAFRHTFGTSEYEGCHMNMLGFLKSGSALVVTWDDAYVFPELRSELADDGPYRQKLTAAFEMRGTARSLRILPLGRGDINTLAAGYRRYAEKTGRAVTLREKIRRQPHLEKMLGASNAKLWTCLNRKMNEQSTAEESVKVHWTFDEAARIAEHLKNDLEIDRCFFMMGGWTEGGYDCRHPDNLPANPECGGNDALADAVRRIQSLGYVACLHDNVQDMYADAKSFSPDFIEKNPDGSMKMGGRWLGGRAHMVCAPKQLELARRPQNLPAIAELFRPWSYFIDTTYAVGPRECSDPNHPIDRNGDIAWKIQLSDFARETFGIFGSECGREWALPHSDFFEGLVAVSGRYYHMLKPEELGATVIPFWEMVYHDCQVCYGKYGYAADRTGQFVAHHVLCARPLYYHSFGDHLYWKAGDSSKAGPDVEPLAAYTRSDNGWAAGLHPLDVFVKNTHEVLGPLNHVTAYDLLTDLEFLTGDRDLRKATYGRGEKATSVTVNFGEKEARVTTAAGADVVLPQWGFVIEGPRFVAFYALRWGGRDYDHGALFTLRPLDARNLAESRRIRIFHAFGPASIAWKDQSYDVPKESIIEL